MLRSLNSGISGLQNFQNKMDVIGNNIANVNTLGYKAARMDFADAFSQTLQGSSAGNGTSAGNAAMQIGTGVSMAAIRNQYTQGMLSGTGVQSDLAVDGEGYFIVKNIAGQEFATRAGDFHFDSNGYLVTNNGLNVQGYTDSARSTIGNIKLDNNGVASEVIGYSFGQDGTLNVSLKDGTSIVRGQVLLDRFQSPDALVKQGDNLYSGLTEASRAGLAAPNAGGLGTVKSSYLELSNVDLTTEFAGLITTQRAFQANARVITTSDELLQEITNLKR